jgi:signal recognition particle GTPase
MASRILGMGDVLSLIERAEESLDELFKAAPPPKSFDADVAENFVRKLDALSVDRK